MRATTALTLAAGVTAASAQLLPNMVGPLSFSNECQAALIQVLSSGDFAQCAQTAELLPIITQNASIPVALDNWMSGICYNQPCSNDTLQQASNTILQACASDLEKDNLPNSTVTTAFDQYDVVREVLCLKTNDPYTNTSYGGFLGNPAIPIDGMTYNSTDGYFCVTSLLTQLSAYYGADLNLPYFMDVAQNDTAVFLTKQINANILCNECIFGAVDVVEAAFPSVGNLDPSKVFGFVNMLNNTMMPGMLPPMSQIPVPGDVENSDVTVNEYLNQTCAYKPLYVSTDGMLPENVTVSIVNSTFPAQITPGHS